MKKYWAGIDIPAQYFLYNFEEVLPIITIQIECLTLFSTRVLYRARVYEFSKKIAIASLKFIRIYLPQYAAFFNKKFKETRDI